MEFNFKTQSKSHAPFELREYPSDDEPMGRHGVDALMFIGELLFTAKVGEVGPLGIHSAP